jgi:hypothetical protein
MPGSVPTKDIWDKFKICAELAIAIGALLFTYVYNEKQQRNAEGNLRLAASNIEIAKAQASIAKAQARNALIPPLTSTDQRQRQLALNVARDLDMEIAVDVLSTSLNDPSPEVQVAAASGLRSLSRDAPEEVRKKAQKGLDQYDITSELREKGLLVKLREAERYIQGGNVSGKGQALQIYREAVSMLSPVAISKLDARLLGGAARAFQEGHTDDAIRDYRALFAEYI